MNRKIAPPIKDAIEYNLLLKPYDHFVLDNGIHVYSVNAGAQEVIQLELVFYAGNCFEEEKGIAAATNFLLKNGTSTKSAFQINEAFDYYGAYCSRACYNESATITLHSLTKHVDHLFPIIQEIVTDAVFPEKELEIYQQNAKQRLQVNLQKADFVAGRLIDSYVYGEHHPYGVYTNASDIDAVTPEKCKKFYEKFYRNGQCNIFLSGNYSESIKQKLNQFFGQLTVSKKALEIPVINRMPAQQKKYRIENDSNAVQGAIRLASPFPNKKHPDFKKAMVLNTVFGGFFGARLMSNIREDKGYTYGIYSYIQNHVQNTAWVVSTEAGKDVSEATISEIYKEMKRLREEKISEEELLLVRNYMIGGLLGELDGPFQIMAKWKNIVLNNMDEHYFYDTVHEIKTVSADELLALANKYLHPEHFYELVVY